MPAIPPTISKSGIIGTGSSSVGGNILHRGAHTPITNQHHSTQKIIPGSNSRPNKGGGTGSVVGVPRNGLNAKMGLTDEVVMISTAQETSPDVSSIIYIVGGCTLGLMVILVAVLAAAYVRARTGNRTAESRGFLHV